MRRLLPVSALLLAACASTPPPTPTPKPTPKPVEVRSGISGLSQPELVQRFGVPAFQVREGPGLKLQWQNATCVLDAYLYPPTSGSGVATVLHADARRPGSGDPLPVEGCITSLAPPRL
ncbi:hypothetical protein [Sphingomonas astaxanthinifaciens]|uniref:Lipoprotein n=1 Tax=Sphingomonas astaxanthinifaciens DSM 22298 TaxID=1123267 RepID=A0ABQ5Z7V9_9SPHN|nr:hypothetical protein [Sphingomonas astaxanthinifaciens]GLR47536.1 hypothetical protein GCM10007925_12480 [Sphingomonas astaxanthinifaciens DSM 22298]